MHEPPGAHENEVKPVVSSIMLPALQVEPLKVAVSLSPPVDDDTVRGGDAG